MAAGDDSRGRAGRGLSILADRDVRRAYIAGIARRAGVDLMPISAWLLIRLGEDAGADLVTLAAEQGVTAPSAWRKGSPSSAARGFVAGAGQYRHAGRLRSRSDG